MRKIVTIDERVTILEKKEDNSELIEKIKKLESRIKDLEEIIEYKLGYYIPKK